MRTNTFRGDTQRIYDSIQRARIAGALGTTDMLRRQQETYRPILEAYRRASAAYAPQKSGAFVIA